MFRQNNEGLTEPNVNLLLNSAKDSGNKLAKYNTESDDSFLHTISSGSKGDWVNITQITGLLGQQNVCGKRIAYTSHDKKRSLSCFPTEFDDSWNGIKSKFESQGFVSNSFHTGLNPVEFFFHAASGFKIPSYRKKYDYFGVQIINSTYDALVIFRQNNIFCVIQRWFDSCKDFLKSR